MPRPSFCSVEPDARAVFPCLGPWFFPASSSDHLRPSIWDLILSPDLLQPPMLCPSLSTLTPVVHSIIRALLQGHVVHDGKTISTVHENCHGGHREAQQLWVGQAQSMGSGLRTATEHPSTLPKGKMWAPRAQVRPAPGSWSRRVRVSAVNEVFALDTSPHPHVRTQILTSRCTLTAIAQLPWGPRTLHQSACRALQP